MAKENYISLRGQERGQVYYVKDENGTPIQALFSLHTLRRDAYDCAGNFEPKFNMPIIVTKDPRIIQKTFEIKKNDIVEIKGSFLTGKIVKHKKCPVCGLINDYECASQVIAPQYVGVLKTGIRSDNVGLKELVNSVEISNICKVIGRVCSPEIKTGITERGENFTTYQIAVNRKFFLYGTEDEEDHTDYPYVISYGTQAELDAQTLKQGSLIYIDGYVHTMITPMEVKCANEKCGEVIKVDTQRMTITPYSVEYLRDYNDVLSSTHQKSRDIGEN